MEKIKQVIEFLLNHLEKITSLKRYKALEN